MAERSLVATALLLLAVLGLSACGSGADTTTTAPAVTQPAVSRETADHLAKLSDRVASDLDAGQTCSAAYAADDLKSAIEESDLPSDIRPDVDRVADDLVNQVNCPPPPPPPEPEPKKEPKQKDDQGPGNSGDQGPGNGGHSTPPGHSKHGGVVPPGHDKKDEG
jgi:hypothetical protein